MGIFKNAKDELIEMEMSGTREVTGSGVQRVIVEGKDWGPAITKIVIQFNDYALQPNSFDSSYFTVEEKVPTNIIRTITNAYVCNPQGEQLQEPSDYIALEMFVSPTIGSPVYFDMKTLSGNWLSNYTVDTKLVKPIQIDEQLTLTSIFVNKKMNLTNKYQRITPEANQFKFESDDTYGYAWYAPKVKKESYPLVIWLHGGGEGGTDLYKCIYGNKVVSLISDEFQEYFGGAYVLVPQAKTYWMEGYGTFGPQLQFTPSGNTSIYTESLMKLIQNFVSTHPIDQKQIIVGGCSNGGYMSLQLLVDYPEYFAAGYNICEGMLDTSITDAQIDALAKSQTGVYFIYSTDDPVFNHKDLTSIPTYNRLKKAKANVHVSEFNKIEETYEGLDEPYTNQYSGHFAWVKFFNNECDQVWEKLSKERKA